MKKTYTNKCLDADYEDIYNSEKKNNPAGNFKPMRDFRDFKILESKLKLAIDMLETTNLIGQSVLDKLKIPKQKHIKNTAYKMVNESKIIPNGWSGLEVVGGIITNVLRVDEVTDDEIPSDILNGCYRWVDGKIELDQDKVAEAML